MKKSLLILMLAFFACEKDKTIEPAITTISFVFSETTGCTATGRIDELGTRTVTDHGFIYAAHQWFLGGDVSEAQTISLGIPSKTGAVSVNIPILKDYWGTRTYYARMYIVSEKGTIYGDVQSCIVPSY